MGRRTRIGVAVLGSFSWGAAFLIGMPIMVLLVGYGLKELSRNGFALLPVFTVLVGIAVGVVFVERQRRAVPLLDRKLFGARMFRAGLLLTTVAARDRRRTGAAVLGVIGMAVVRAGGDTHHAFAGGLNASSVICAVTVLVAAGRPPD